MKQWILTIFFCAADYVQNRILRVFAYGSPPVAEMISSPPPKQGKKQKVMPGLESTHCQVLETFGLPTTMVFGYIQPYVSHKCGNCTQESVHF